MLIFVFTGNRTLTNSINKNNRQYCSQWPYHVKSLSLIIYWLQKISKPTFLYVNFCTDFICFACSQTRLQNGTKLKKILQDSKESVGESDIRSRMQQLIEQLSNTINHLHSIFETHVFVAICRGYWDRMGQVVNYICSF